MKLNTFLVAASVAFVATQAEAISVFRPLGPAQQVSGSKSIVQSTIERSLKTDLSDFQVDNIRRITETLQETPQKIMFEERGFTALICVGAKAAFFISAQVGVCSDLSGNVFYTQTSGLGLSGGLAGQVYTLLAIHDPDQPIAPQFSGLALGGTSGKIYEKLGLLKDWANKLSLVGPELGVYHSIYGNQASILIGASFGKFITTEIGKIQIFDSFRELKDSVMSGSTSMPYEDFASRLEARKVRLNMK